MNKPDTHYTIDDLQYLMQRLREPRYGCPWDQAQSYKSIAASTIEEMYEVIDAIEQNDLNQLKDELGDLLFQIIFYSQLGKEDNAFTFTDITTAITNKLINRHPHVFPDGTLESRSSGLEADRLQAQADIKKKWEQIKQQERLAKGQKGIMADVPRALPATIRASKLQKRAASVGFDWPNTDGVYSKIDEEVNEVKAAVSHLHALQTDNRKVPDKDLSSAGEQVIEEIGDLLFSVINLARHLKVDPETALRHANNKFEQRFQYLEDTADRHKTSIEAQSLASLEAWWQASKNQ
jgi:ATP diphosphatase